jgi:hypothetical protein
MTPQKPAATGNGGRSKSQHRQEEVNLTNYSYVISIGTKNFTERYYRDRTGWLKVSARGRRFRMTAEQVLNHVLPALAGLKPNLTIKVEHRDPPARSRENAPRPSRYARD